MIRLKGQQPKDEASIGRARIDLSLPAALRRRVRLAAAAADLSMGQWVQQAIEHELVGRRQLAAPEPLPDITREPDQAEAAYPYADFDAEQALATLRAAGLSLQFSPAGRPVLAPPARVTPALRQLAQDHAPALKELLGAASSGSDAVPLHGRPAAAR